MSIVKSGWLFWVMALMLAGCGGATPPATPTATPYIVVVTRTPLPTANPNGVADRSIGAANAFLTITFYGDFQSPACALIARSLAGIQAKYPNDVRILWRYLPNPKNDKANLAAQAAEAAYAQGHFRDMHDQLFLHQTDWAALDVAAFRTKLDEYAKTIGLADLAAFDRALDSGTYAPLIAQAAKEAANNTISDAPALLFNNVLYTGRIEDYVLDGQTRLTLLQKRWFASQPEFTLNLAHQYTATLHTEKGDIQIDLYPRSAPAAVNSFVFLARSGWYDNNRFDFVLPGLYAQTGDPSDTGLGTAGYNIVDEHDNGLIFDREGQVAMVQPSGTINTASSQFFITFGPLRPAQDYDKQYTIFGHVSQGMDILRKLTPRNPLDEVNSPNPPPGDRLISVTIAEH
jgi:cyclophilin family peptidyl-prolyl cis-trans isomerase/protein-disulfide isomerase